MTSNKYPTLSKTGSDFEFADDVGDGFVSVIIKVGVDAVDDFQRSKGINEVGGTDGDGGGSGEEELDGIVAVHDSAHVDNRNFDRLSRFVDHTDGDRLDGGT